MWLLLPSILLAPLSALLYVMVRVTESYELYHGWNLLWTAFDVGAEGNAAVWFASALWLLVAALLIRLVLALRTRVTIGLIGSGATFLFGALVLESVTGIVERDQGRSDLYMALQYVEETFKLVGAAWAVVALASIFLLFRCPGGVTLTFDGYRPTAPGTGAGRPASA